MTVFLVQHSYEVETCGHDETKFIGIYSSRELAESAVQRLSTQPGFRDRPADFQVNEVNLDADHWAEGYISWSEASREIRD